MEPDALCTPVLDGQMKPTHIVSIQLHSAELPQKRRIRKFSNKKASPLFSRNSLVFHIFSYTFPLKALKKVSPFLFWPILLFWCPPVWPNKPDKVQSDLRYSIWNTLIWTRVVFSRMVQWGNQWKRDRFNETPRQKEIIRKQRASNLQHPFKPTGIWGGIFVERFEGGFGDVWGTCLGGFWSSLGEVFRKLQGHVWEMKTCVRDLYEHRPIQNQQNLFKPIQQLGRL